MSLSKLVFSQKRALLVLTVLVCGLGLYLSQQLPAAIFPSTSFPRIVILLENGVVPPEQMLATITQPVEEAMNGIPGISRIQSNTSRGSADINLFFDWKVDPQLTLQIVQQRLSALSLPSTVNIKRVDRLTFAVFPVAGYSLVSPSRTGEELREIARYDIRPRLARLPGVANVSIAGGETREYHVEANLEKMVARGVSIQKLCNAVSSANLTAAAGLLDTNHQFETALVSGQATRMEQLRDIVVARSSSTNIHVSDVAEVRKGLQPNYTIVQADGKPAVLLNILRQPSANTVAVSEEVKVEIEKIREKLPADITIKPFYDQAIMVRESMLSVRDAILIGLGLSVVILFVFLGDIRTTGIAVLVIPATVLVAILAMYGLGLSYNLMTLGGLAAAIGLIIDDAVVMVENIHSLSSQEPDRRKALERALREVAKPILVSTITPVVVFLPLTLLSGVAGVFFRSMALTMTVALLTSLFFALTLTPILADTLMSKVSAGGEDADGAILRACKSLYAKLLQTSLKRRFLVAAICAAAVFSAFQAYRNLGSEFLPSFDEGAFVLDYLAPAGSSLKETHKLLHKVETILLATPEVESYSLRVGLQLGLSNTAPNTGDFLVKLKPDRSRTTEEVVDDIREQIERTDPVLSVEFAGILNDLIGDLTSSPSPILIRLYCQDTELLHSKAGEVEDAIQQIPGIVDTNSGVVTSGPSVTFNVNPDKAATFSTDTSEVSNAIATVLTGTPVSTILEGSRVRTVRVSCRDELSDSVQTLESLPLCSTAGIPYRLSQVAEPHYVGGETEIERNGLRKSVTISARVSQLDLGTAIKRIKAKLKNEVEFPKEISVEYGGLYAEQQTTFREMLFSLVLAIVLVYFVLLLDFRSNKAAVSIMVGSTLSLCGVFWALYFTGATLNVVSFMGMIMVVGIVAKNGVLLLDALEQESVTDEGLTAALLHAGQRRFRPVLMTSLAAILGMAPLAMAVGAGAELLQPLAIAVIGGLVLSLPLALVVTPVVLSILHDGEFKKKLPFRQQIGIRDL